MRNYSIPFWKNAPFIRLLFPFMAGIILQWYCQFAFPFIVTSLASFGISFTLFYYLSIGLRFRLLWLQGLLLNLIIASFAMLTTWQKDERNHKEWYGNKYEAGALLVVKLTEPPIEKSKSYKADALVEGLIIHDSMCKTEGKTLLYFSKNDTTAALRYGDHILINKDLQRIKNSGNPGAFNYERYAAFQQIFHNIYLKPADFVRLPSNDQNWFDAFLFSARTYIVTTIQKYLPDDKNVTGIAEALLIGYKEDLDKDLVQAYSNTGVVHIIAISGLHLGLIYVMLVWLFDLIPFVKKQKLLKVVLILGFLWVFSLLTGASASVLRSAVMFTCIVIGKNYFKQASIYNSLAASAFLLLCFNPYFLWDVGFQLSYCAVYGIVWLQQPVYHIFYIKNKWLNKIWQMISVTVAAQIITFPICIYYFHQFPNSFLITNLLAVPLSTVILFAEIFLIMFSWFPLLAGLLGRFTYWSVWLMNWIINTCNNLPYSLIDKIYATPLTTILLYGIVAGTSAWLLYQNKKMLRYAMICLLAFACVHGYAKYKLQSRQKIIIYNVSQHQAIDFIYKDKYFFVGDSALTIDGLLQNFNLKPARVMLQLDQTMERFPHLSNDKMIWQFANKKIMIVDSALSLQPLTTKIKVDILLISKNPKVNINNLIPAISPAVVVFDGSNSLWKIAQWKKQCEQLLLPCFSVSEKGAYTLDVND